MDYQLIHKNTKKTETIKQILNTSPLKQFLVASNDKQLNNCLLKSCEPDEMGGKCSNSNILGLSMLYCLGSDKFLKKHPDDKTPQDFHRCYMRCQLRNMVDPASKEFFMLNKKDQLSLINKFLNPAQHYHEKFQDLNASLISDKEVWDYFSYVKEKNEGVNKQQFDVLARKMLDKHFEDKFSKDFKENDLVVTKCAYYCDVFDPKIKNKIRYYGEGIMSGKFKEYNENLDFLWHRTFN